MRQLCIIFLIVSLGGCYGQETDHKQTMHLWQITEKRKSGFINSEGQIVIKPIFAAAGEFSEGLAHARLNGTYGYIDKTGNFEIQPQFDYATSFNEGLAIVYKEGKPLYINKKGQKAFDCNFPVLGGFENGKAIVQTATKKMGIIDREGKLFLDTVFTRISNTINGLTVVEGLNHHSYKGIKEVGVIDALGKFIIPFGKYEDISDVEGGYFQVVIPAEPWDTIDGYSSKIGFVDMEGKVILARDHSNGGIDGNIHCGFVKMYLDKPKLSESEDSEYVGEETYQGFINLKGEIAINDTKYRYVKDFSDNRAFVQTNNGDYLIINLEGKVITKDTYRDVLGEGFKNGVAFVEKDGKWGLIDTNANFIIQPKFDGIDYVGMVNDYFFFTKDNPDKKSEYEQLYGIAHKNGSVLMKSTIIQQFDRRGFLNGLLKCIIDDKLTYIDKQGRIVWNEAGYKSKQLTNLNIDMMNRGYFYAYSKPNKKNIGGFGKSENISKKISRSNNFPSNTLSITVQPETKGVLYGNCRGIAVFVANCKNKEISFNAQDSRLYMKVQALNVGGEWQDIEYLPGSWCGNSYHTLTLEPQNFWAFWTPVYEGDIKTKLRIELRYIDSDDKSQRDWERKEITLYSNEYEGSINPGQFWRKQDYYPQGIMDPYNE